MPSIDEPKKPGRPKGLPKTGGRRRGVPNKLGSTISETFRNFLGLDDEAVARTGRIDGKGYGCRVRLKEMLDGKRDPDPAWTGLLRVALSYAYGLPRRMEPDTATDMARRVAFITPNGLPWDQDPLYDREQAILRLQGREERLELEMKKDDAAQGRPGAKQEAQTDKEDLELVRPEDLS
jgi:hypothetical protein